MNRRRGLTAGIITMISAALVLAVVGGAVAAKKKTVKATAQLSGAKEVPPADPDGTGVADFKLKKKRKKVCFDIDFQNIEAPFVAHIHPGAEGVNGPPLITLFDAPGSTSPQSGCVRAKKKQIKRIAKNPDDYYCNLHNDPYPGGAIRGQLDKGGKDKGGKERPGGTPTY
jgi:CHRD domain